MVNIELLKRDIATGILWGSLKEIGYSLPFPRMIQVKSNVSNANMTYIIDTVKELTNKEVWGNTKAEYIAAKDVKSHRLILYAAPVPS